jgi:hypothetical protein
LERPGNGIVRSQKEELMTNKKFDPAPEDKHADPKPGRDGQSSHGKLDRELKETFPASDPPSETQPSPSKP